MERSKSQLGNITSWGSLTSDDDRFRGHVMVLRTIDQKGDGNEFAKARELIEIRGTEQLTLQDRRIINVLYANAGNKLCDDVVHTVSISELRGAL